MSMDLGERIKKLRLNNDMSVRKLAEKVGVTASFIYQLEQNKVSPSFSTLKSIASTLNTSMSMLIEDKLPEEWVIVRKNNRKRLVTENQELKIDLLTFLGTREKKMQPVVFELEVGGISKEMASLHEQREDFIYLFQGKIEVYINKNKYVMEEGDAGYFIFDTPTAIKNVGHEKAVGLWMISPPG